MQQYRSKHVANLYSVSLETVRKWVDEFSEYLSPTARPGKRKQRLYTLDDMAVLSLVAEQKNQGLTFREIHASLKTGQRGEPPKIDPNEIQAIVSTEHESLLSLEVERMKYALVQSQNELAQAQEELKKLRETEDNNIRLQTQLDSERQAKQELQQRITELTQEVKQLSFQAGREYAKGFVEGIAQREKGTNSNRGIQGDNSQN